MKNNKALLTIFLIVFIDLLGFGLILPLLPFIAEHYGAKPLTVGLLTATYSLFQLIGGPILGKLSDRFGRKRLLLISQIGTLLGFLLLALANNLWLLFLSRAIDGITGGNISIAQAYIADVTQKKDRAKGMGILGAAFGLGFIFGPLIGGLLSQISFHTPAYFAMIISLITIVTNVLFLKETINIKETAKTVEKSFSFTEIIKIIKTPPINSFIAVFLLLSIAFTIMQGNFALWSEKTFGLTARDNGFLFTYIGVLSVIIQLGILPVLLKRFSEKKLFNSSIIILALGFVTLGLANYLGIVLLALFLISLGNGLNSPTLQSLASENVKPTEYGETLGLLSSASSLGRTIGPVMGGYFFGTIGKDFPLFLSALLTLFAYLIVKKGFSK